MNESRIRLLLIEDDEWLANHFRQLLIKQGYEVDWVSDIFKAYRLMDEFKYKLIIADVLLPINNILAMLNELKSYSDLKSLPIILCSNLADELDLDDFKPYGVINILDKAIMLPEDLVTRVNGVLQDES